MDKLKALQVNLKSKKLVRIEDGAMCMQNVKESMETQISQMGSTLPCGKLHVQSDWKNGNLAASTPTGTQTLRSVASRNVQLTHQILSLYCLDDRGQDNILTQHACSSKLGVIGKCSEKVRVNLDFVVQVKVKIE